MNSPIGIMDSGLGGLSVWREVKALLPHESIIYYADQAHCPYGPQSIEAVRKHVINCVDRLLAQNCKLILLACNTATAAAIDFLREHYDVPFVGMEPAIKPAAVSTQTGAVGVLATAGTLSGQLYQQTKSNWASEIKVMVQAGEGLVEIVESNQIDAPETNKLLEQYLNPMLEAGIDHLVLGCTHYPFLMEPIKKICGPGVKLIDPAPAVARRVKQVLSDHKLCTQLQVPVYAFQSSLNNNHSILDFLEKRVEGSQSSLNQ